MTKRKEHGDDSSCNFRNDVLDENLSHRNFGEKTKLRTFYTHKSTISPFYVKTDENMKRSAIDLTFGIVNTIITVLNIWFSPQVDPRGGT